MINIAKQLNIDTTILEPRPVDFFKDKNTTEEMA
jgi:hypothetical protein